ncbi:MAG: 50S ribosomal protein L4 [Patescibacteria group bacterium]
MVNKISNLKSQKLRTKIKRASGLTIDCFDIQGKAAEKIELPKEIFGAKVNNQLMAQSVRVYLANQRMGTASTKTRGEVSGSTKKIWAQKHTGRARHGSRKAPIFVGGGIVFGPKPRDFSLKLSKKMKRLALFSALTSKFKKGQLKGLTGFEKIEPKTKLMVSAMKNLGIRDKDKKVLLVTPSTKKEFENVYRASRNIKGVNIVNADILNVYEVLDNKLILLMKPSIDVMKETFLKMENI